MMGREDEARRKERGRGGWRRPPARRKGRGGEAGGWGLGSVPGVASEETLRELTRGRTAASREEAGPHGSVVWRGATGRRPGGRREQEAWQSEAAGWSAERQVVGKPETGPAPRGRTRSLTGGPERRSDSRVRRAVGIGGRSPREEVLRLEEQLENWLERPGQSWELGLGGWVGKFPREM